jgi:hypothetical protein
MHDDLTQRQSPLSSATPSYPRPSSRRRPQSPVFTGLGAGELVMLFWHLGQVLSRLASGIVWNTFDPVQKSRLLAALDVLASEIMRAQQAATHTTNPTEERDSTETAKAASTEE